MSLQHFFTTVQQLTLNHPSIFKQYCLEYVNIYHSFTINNSLDNLTSQEASSLIKFPLASASLEANRLHQDSKDQSLLFLSVTLASPLLMSMIDLLLNNRSFDLVVLERIHLNCVHYLQNKVGIIRESDFSSSFVEKLISCAEQWLLSHHPFNNSYHSHIGCSDLKCTICKHLYLSTRLSACYGHLPCLSSGYFPHVDVAMWSRIRLRHREGGHCKGQPVTNASEIISILQYRGRSLDYGVEIAKEASVMKGSTEELSTASVSFNLTAL